MKRREFVQLLGLGATYAALPCLSSCAVEKTNGAPPNFVIMLADDMGWDDLALHGNTVIDTPNLDSLASESVQFNKFYVNPVCAPTRASFLTGRHFLRTGVSHVHGGKDFLALDEITFPQALRDNGYATGMWGKWHSGKTEGYQPWQRGFDEALSLELYKHKDPAGMLNGERVEHPGWATEVITDYALDFIERQKDRPFLAYMPFLSCHAPLVARDSVISKYEQRGVSRSLATVYAMVERIDTQVKRVLENLDELGIAENTVVMFLSDNGPAVLNDKLTDANRKQRYVNELQGHKGNIWENGVRSPFFVRWKGHYKPAVVNRLADCCDLYPTILGIAGIENPHERLLDGRDIHPYFEGDTKTLQPKISYDYASPGWPPTDEPWTPKGLKDEYRPVTPAMKKDMRYDQQILSIQDETWKLLVNPGLIDEMPEAALQKGISLFNIDKDPQQDNELSAQEPEKVSALQAQLSEWWQSVLSEKNSFAAPVFLVGHNNALENEVIAYGPADVSPSVKIAFNFLWDMKAEGDFAEYRLRVETPGEYKVTLEHLSGSPGGRISLTCGTSEATALVSAEMTEAGTLQLEQGEQRLRLEVVEPSEDGPVFDELYTLKLMRV